MKRLSIILAIAAIFAVSCIKDVDPDLPQIQWAANSGFAVAELAPGLDGSVVLTAVGKIQSITVTLGLGDYNLLANPYISLMPNKGSGSKSPVFDLIDDTSVAKFMTEHGMAGGSLVRGNTVYSFNLVTILEALIEGQPVENNTGFSMEIKLTDQEGNAISKVAKFHYTSAPAISWSNNPDFDVVDLNGETIPCKVKITAPGRITELTVALDYGGSPELANYIKNRTTGATTVIDLINDERVADSFKEYFPAASVISGKTEATLDFGFLFVNKYDFSPATNVFNITVKDKNGKESLARVKFKK